MNTVTTYHPSRTAARDFAKINNGKVIDLGTDAKARWAVESEEGTVQMFEAETRDALTNWTDTYKVKHDKPYQTLPANARILVSRNKREGKKFVKISSGPWSKHSVYIRGELAKEIRAIRDSY